MESRSASVYPFAVVELLSCINIVTEVQPMIYLLTRSITFGVELMAAGQARAVCVEQWGS